MLYFFNQSAPNEIYTFPLHAPLPICRPRARRWRSARSWRWCAPTSPRSEEQTSELQSPYVILYAVFLFKKKLSDKRCYIFLISRRPTRSTPFPYTPLFQSVDLAHAGGARRGAGDGARLPR